MFFKLTEFFRKVLKYSKIIESIQENFIDTIY